MKKEICDFIGVMSQIVDIDKSELSGLMELTKRFHGHEHFLLPNETRNYLIKSKILSLKLIKDKSKQKEMAKLIKEHYEKLKKLEAE